jgi:proteasome accessory factor C
VSSPSHQHAALTPLDLAVGSFRPAPDGLLAAVRLGREARWVTEYHPVESATEEPDGGLTVTLRVGDPAWLVRLLLRLGGTATLVDPPELAEQVRDTALRALHHYT